jgi:hypothetical protein
VFCVAPALQRAKLNKTGFEDTFIIPQRQYMQALLAQPNG